jgi:hypothetical protein
MMNSTTHCRVFSARAGAESDAARQQQRRHGQQKQPPIVAPILLTSRC